MERRVRLAERDYLDPYYPAVAAGALGDSDRAFELLDELCAGPSVSGFNVLVDPLLDPLRGDPRYDAILERLGLPPGEGSAEGLFGP